MPLVLMPDNRHPHTLRLSMISEWTWQELFDVTEHIENHLANATEALNLVADMRYSTTPFHDIGRYFTRIKIRGKHQLNKVIFVSVDPNMVKLVCSIPEMFLSKDVEVVPSVGDAHQILKHQQNLPLIPTRMTTEAQHSTNKH